MLDAPLIDKTIASAQNAIFGDWCDCLTSKGIKKHGLFFVAGERAVRETLEAFPALARSLILCSDRHVPASEGGTGKSGVATSWINLVERARELTKDNELRFTAIAVARALFDELDVSGTHAPLLLAHTPEIEDVDLTIAPEGLEVMCALGDPANVGALLRSAAAFGASKVILLRESASPFSPKAVRAASASTLTTRMERGPSIRDLHSMLEDTPPDGRHQIIALDMHGKKISDFKWPRNIRLLIGEEGQGVPSSPLLEYVSIPIAAEVESLNYRCREYRIVLIQGTVSVLNRVFRA